MPKKPVTPFLSGDIFARVRQMAPVARKLLIEGFDDDRIEFTMDLPCKEPVVGDSDENVRQFVEWTQTVYAVGIAVGLLLRPETFGTGGAR